MTGGDESLVVTGLLRRCRMNSDKRTKDQSMGVIEGLQKSKVGSTSLALGLIVLAGSILTYSSWPDKKFNTQRAYFTTDEGKTWYEDSVDLIPPYMHEGKPAVRAMIYTTEKGAKPFCAYLLQFDPATKASIEQAAAAGAKQNPPEAAHIIAFGINFSNRAQVKVPGTADWVPSNSPEGMKVLTIKSPDGSEVDQVMP